MTWTLWGGLNVVLFVLGVVAHYIEVVIRHWRS